MSVFSYYLNLKISGALVETPIEHCLTHSRYSLDKLHFPDQITPNVLAINKLGVPLYFQVCEYGRDREVLCYYQGNGILCTRDINDVFFMINQHCLCWCTIKNLKLKINSLKEEV